MRPQSRGFLALLLASSLTSSPARALTLLYSNDVQGEIEPCGCRANPFGGMVRKSGLVEKLKKKGEKTFLQLDGGNLLFDSDTLPDALVPQWKIQSDFLMRAHVRLGRVIITPGPKDFALGEAHLRKISRNKDATWLSLNLVKENGTTGKPSPLFSTEERIPLGKRHLTVLGYSSPSLSYPEGLKTDEKIQELKKQITAAKARGDKTLLLSHQGLDADRALAKQIPQIDFIIGGHSQSFLSEPVLEGKTRIYQSSFRNQYIGVLKLSPTGEILSHELVGLDESYETLAQNGMKKLVADYKQAVAKTNTKATAKLERTSSSGKSAHPYQTYVTCFECHQKQFDQWRKTPHALALTSLKKQNQLENLECLRCHSVGQSAAKGYGSLKEIASLKTDGEPKSWAISAVEAFHQELSRAKDLDSPVRLTRTDLPKPASQALREIAQDFSSVQCESCHGRAGNHPFEGDFTKTVTQETCLKCHTSERAPTWYKGGKVDASLFAKKLKLVACPRDHGDEDPRN